MKVKDLLFILTIHDTMKSLTIGCDSERYILMKELDKVGVNRMTSIPWHVERVHRQSGDDRRQKKNCKFYDEGTCWAYAQQCKGSAHCIKYREKDKKQILEEIKQPNKENNKKKKKAKTKTVPMFSESQNNISLVSNVDYHKKFQFGLLQIDTTDLVCLKIMEKFEKQGFYNFQVIVEDLIIKSTIESIKINKVFLALKGKPILCSIKQNTFSIINSCDYMTTSFEVIGFDRNETYILRDYEDICEGFDPFYGNIAIKLKKVNKG